MEYILENDLARVCINSKAAEIYSFYKKSDNLEIMWNGDATYWSGRNPILFPQVGNTYNKTQVFKGEEYHMGNHGIARHSEFAFVSQNDDTLTLVLKADENTKKEYPYDFALYVTYHLVNTKLEISYRIDNNDQDVMPFGFGLHPAFNCPICTDEKFDDYYIEFSSSENDDSAELKLIKDGKLYLNRDLFKNYPTVIYNKLNSQYVTLSNGKHSIKVTCSAYPMLAIWSPDNAPFVCIEPWYSHGDFKEVNLAFEDREGIISLKPNQKFNTGYSIEII